MAKVTAKFELMTNAFPAGSLKLTGSFYVVEDQGGEHMIFSTDRTGRLVVILKGQSGHNEYVDLSEKLNLPKEQKITALAVSQNKNGQIHLVFALAQPDGSDMLFVLRPMAPTREEWTRQFDLANDLYTGQLSNIKIREIMLGTSNDATENNRTLYPPMYLVFKHVTKSTEDIWIVSVDVEKKRWDHVKGLEMPINPQDIISKCTANIQLFRGLYVLYREVGGALQLRFVGLDPTERTPVLASFAQTVPEGATRLAGIENRDGYTDLLISGKELTWRSADEWFNGDETPFTVISTDTSLASPSQTLIAQSSESFSFWSLGQDSLLVYQEFVINKGAPPSSRTPVIPLLERDSSSNRFAALQHPAFGQKVFVIDKEGSMKMLEQTLESGLWQSPIDVMIPQLEEMTEYLSHTIQVKFEDNLGAPLIEQSINVSASASTEMIVNGKSIRGSASGQNVNTDESGLLTIIIPADGMTAPTIMLKNGDPKAKILDNTVNIDPMSKLWKTVEDLKTGDDLKKMQLPDGSSFVKPGIDDNDLKQAAEALQKMSAHRQTSLSTSATTQSVSVQSQGGRSGGLWGAWHWLKSKITKAAEWVVEKVQGVWKFIVKIAGQVWDFVLETAQQIAAALQKVLEFIAKGIDSVINFFKFLFSWGDILDVKNVLVNLTTQGLLWGVDGIALLELKTHEFFQDLRSQVRQLKDMALPDDIARLKAGNDKGLETGKNKKEQQDTLDSPQGQYGNYHLKHSGALGEQTNTTPVDRLIARLSAVFKELENLGGRVKDNLATAFTSKDIPVEQVFKKMGLELLEDILGVIEKLVVGIIGSFGDLILEIVDGINKPISIPVLSPLYKAITRGSTLTMLDLVALCVAIPTTIIFKLISNKKPKDIAGISELTQYNAMRPELDRRMGRLRSEMPSVSNLQANPPAAPEVASTGAKDDRSIATESSSSSQDITKKGNLLPGQHEAIKYNQKRFAKSSNVVSDIVKIAVPSGSFLWYLFYTFPKLYKPEGPPTAWKVQLGFSIKLLLWLGSFVSIAKWNSDVIKKSDFDLPWDDPEFKHRFGIWLFGGITVITSYLGKYVGHVVEIISAVVQAAFLGFMQISAKAGYSTYLAAEEWSKVLCKIATGFSGMVNGSGDGGILSGIGMFLMSSGSIMNLVRVGMEMNGEKDVLCTGMDMVA